MELLVGGLEGLPPHVLSPFSGASSHHSSRCPRNPDSPQIAYTYDGDGNRLSLSDGGTLQTSYLWDPNASLPQLAVERNGSGSLLRRYVYDRGLLSMRTGGSDYYFLHDGLGTIANLTNSTGAAKWTYTYEPYGTVRTATSGSGAPTNLMRFDGQLIDTTTGLYDLRARMYDAASGRFLEEDGLIPPLEVPFVGLFSYARNQPTISDDPGGLWCVVHNASGGCLGGGVVEAVSDWSYQHTWQLAGDAVALGCIAVTGGVCAALVVALAVDQTYVLAQSYGSLDRNFWENAACGGLQIGFTALVGRWIGGSLTGVGVGAAEALNKAAQQMPSVYANSWQAWNSPGCWSAPGSATSK